jgi:predicted TIM-barrel fold metal-dependent hydrolase
MTYARGIVYDADSHLMEGFDWLHRNADAKTRALLPDLTSRLGAGGAGAETAVAMGLERIGNAAKVAELEADVIGSAKGWMALGAMDVAERSRALDLLGFESQLVFSTFSSGLFAFAADLDLVYGGASAHNRMMSDFCGADERLVGVGFLPLNDVERALSCIDEAVALGCGAFWVPHAATAGRSPAHKDNDPIWATLAERNLPVVLHIGGGKSQLSNAWHNNGHPKPVDIHGGGENLRSKDVPFVHQAAETFLGVLALDGVFERHPTLKVGSIELGAAWVPSLLDRLDYAVKSFRREPLIAELTMKPSEYLRRQVRFTPFAGEDVGKLIAQSGPELYLFSSDYPHPEGTRDPIGKFEASLDEHQIGAEARQLFYADNYRELVAV